MPLPHWIAVLNKRLTNRFIEPVVRRTKFYAVVDHTGRTTGRHYRTSIYVFPGAPQHWYVALTYGPGADWVRNIVTEGGSCQHGTDTYRIEELTIVGRPEAWEHLPRAIRVFLRLLTVREFARIRLAPR